MPKVPKSSAKAGRPQFSRSWNLMWGILSLITWVFVQYFHLRRGTPFSFPCFTKGLLVLGAAGAVYQLSSKAFKGPSFLGLFPLLWLALSRFQWDLCQARDLGHWFWLALFLVGEILTLSLGDGKYLLLAMAPVWAALRWFLGFSFLLPLAFLTVSQKKLKNPGWARWGGLAVWAVLFLAYQEWRRSSINWFGAYETCSKLFGEERYAVFFLLGWLGLIAFPAKGTYRHAVWPMLLVTAAFFLWTDPSLITPMDVEWFLWLLVFFAGFGWESFRRDLMDESWHGRAVWVAMGLAFFSGIL
jgi:hypothetical protein